MEQHGINKPDRHAVIGVISPGNLFDWNHVHSLATVNYYRTTRNHVKVSYSEATLFSRTGISCIDIRFPEGAPLSKESLRTLRIRLMNEGWVLRSKNHLFGDDGEGVPA